MLTRPSAGRDFTAIARIVAVPAIGERLDGTPLPDPNEGKNPAAVMRWNLESPITFVQSKKWSALWTIRTDPLHELQRFG